MLPLGLVYEADRRGEEHRRRRAARRAAVGPALFLEGANSSVAESGDVIVADAIGAVVHDRNDVAERVLDLGRAGPPEP